MKNLIFSALLVFSLGDFSVFAKSVKSLATDKAAHFGGSCIVVQSFMKVGQVFNEQAKITWLNHGVSSVLTLGIGYAKEVSDKNKKGGSFDTQDFVADTGGVLAGNLLQLNWGAWRLEKKAKSVQVSYSMSFN